MIPGGTGHRQQSSYMISCLCKTTQKNQYISSATNTADPPLRWEWQTASHMAESVLAKYTWTIRQKYNFLCDAFWSFIDAFSRKTYSCECKKSHNFLKCRSWVQCMNVYNWFYSYKLQEIQVVCRRGINGGQLVPGICDEWDAQGSLQCLWLWGVHVLKQVTDQAYLY